MLSWLFSGNIVYFNGTIFNGTAMLFSGMLLLLFSHLLAGQIECVVTGQAPILFGEIGDEEYPREETPGN